MNRPGALAIPLLLALSGLAAVGAGLLRTAADGARTAWRYHQGLAAQYAAESGAVWGLASLRADGLEGERTQSFSLGSGTATTVRLLRTGGEGDQWTAMVYARGEEENAGILRYTVLTVEVAEGDPRTIIVREVSNSRWD